MWYSVGICDAPIASGIGTSGSASMEETRLACTGAGIFYATDAGGSGPWVRDARTNTAGCGGGGDSLLRILLIFISST